MTEFIRYFFWLFATQIACELKSLRLLEIAVMVMEKSLKILVVKFPRYDFSKVEQPVTEMKQLVAEMSREAKG